MMMSVSPKVFWSWGAQGKLRSGDVCFDHFQHCEVVYCIVVCCVLHYTVYCIVLYRIMLNAFEHRNVQQHILFYVEIISSTELSVLRSTYCKAALLENILLYTGRHWCRVFTGGKGRPVYHYYSGQGSWSNSGFVLLYYCISVFLYFCIHIFVYLCTGRPFYHHYSGRVSRSNCNA